MDIARRLVPTAIRRRYAVKFGIALLILGLSVGLIGYGATAGITNQVEDRVQTDHASSASQEAQSLQMWNEQNEHTIGTIVRSDVVASDDPAAIQQRFLDWQEHLDTDTFDISYVDIGNETVTASTNGAYRGVPASELNNVPSEAYSQATTTVPWVSDAYVAQGEFGQNTTVITYVQLSAANEDRAVVYTADLEAYANQLQDKDGVTTMIVDGDNEIMLDNAGYGSEGHHGDGHSRGEGSGHDHATLGTTYSGDTSLLEAARTDGATTTRISGSELSFGGAYGFDSNEYVTSSARVFGTDWVVVSHEPKGQALGFVNTINQWGIYATILGVLMIGAVGAVLGRNTAVSIDRLTGKAAEMEEGNLDVDLETKRIDNIGRLYNGFDSMRDALREQIEEAEAAREEAERERERVQEINDHLEQKAADYSDVMEAAADGDLTARMAADGDNEAMAEIAEDFNEMLDEIEQTIAELNRFATDVATASEQVTASSEEVRSASQQVTGSIQEISDGADRQNESLQSVNQEMSALSTTTEEIAASSNEVADIAERTVNTGQDGQEAAQEAIAAMDQIETEAGSAVSEIRRLEEEVQQIDELINTISEIARQTNMLALNANIEASRSAGGKDDEGFSVVAKEVKALSEDVAQAADEAEDRLEAIRDRTEESAAEVEGTSADIENASEQVEEAVEALEEIAELAQETNVGVQEISAATEEQAASTQEVVAMVDDAATISEETTSEAENVAAAAEEQTTALTEVTKSASSLSQQAAQLSEALDRFDTEVDREDVDLTSTFDADEELAAEAQFEVDPDAGDDAPDQSRGITFDADDTETSAPTAFDDGDDAGLDIEQDTPTGDPLGTDQPTTDAVEADSSDESLGAGPDDDAAAREATDAPAGDDGATELGADEILGLEDDPADTTATDSLAEEPDAPATDAETASTDDAVGSLVEDAEATEADEVDDEPADAPAGDDGAATTDDAAAQPLESDDGGFGNAADIDAQDGTDAADESDSDEQTADEAPTDEGDEDDGDEDDSTAAAESEDVFTFGTTEDE
ncbi:methyl-accepting chemotaxis protein [Natrinema marinum]|uniref:methyl-accepting chemotaxis protein n=1 Tax=Natrinema marinum TaxID=2961598 RepID=UPI0020C9041A|nr:methyl-accepting chemotaxis protein [Natrinema marinum]